ncbi:Transcriptional regulatory protein ZraR [Posidoniimonas polymericola]|uniref:Transcriptional regulatory protein ZraR n=1 Tax=Posidoniimonas polymericola TaxID=2528002 RepID=A0A5C5XV86_9BACT|nr:sigma 54-interacting transcriptional regulator [Posidoniimonas polymericola]TWT66313.1 Transcriptional regulatory protein ZraR [Posidoniimonas polymericola]
MSLTAYLVIREGSKWTDVFRLVEGESVTVGRAPTNVICIKDERCSRVHSEVFLSQGNWTLRDLDSRNGTFVNGDRVSEDRVLTPGDIVRIGSSHLAFVDNLSQAFPDSGSVLRTARSVENDSPQHTLEYDDDESVLLDSVEPTQITHRREQSRYLEPSVSDADAPIPKVGRAAASLCRIAFTLAKATDVASLANTALDGLFDSVGVDAGAVLLRGGAASGTEMNDKLEVVASRTETSHRYQRVSSFLSGTVLREGQGVLARNVMDDSQLGARDSSGDILATGVLCAPIRWQGEVLGLVHLYTTDSAKPIDPDDLEFSLAVADTIAVALQNLNQRAALTQDLSQVKDENVQLREQLGVQSEIIGSSEAIQKVNQEVARAAPSRATVLIRGESGVGKELVARAVHFSSPRRKGPFVCLNCAALSETLLESELFGHEKGAFTGATDRKKGKFEAAHTGTLILDEIGEMSPTIQAKFLRVLEGHPFERVGGSEAIKVDVRVIAATNRDLEREVAEGNFRRDLYFRLHVLEIIVPGLRKRPEDIPLLAEHFLRWFNTDTGRRIQGFTPKAMEEMLRYRWPGNVREMKNVIERAVVLTRGEFIDASDLVLSTLKTAGDTEVGASSNDGRRGFEPTSLADMEKDHILATLIATGWNKSKTAGILGIERSTLDRKIKRYGLATNRVAAES